MAKLITIGSIFIAANREEKKRCQNRKYPHGVAKLITIGSIFIAANIEEKKKMSESEISTWCGQVNYDREYLHSSQYRRKKKDVRIGNNGSLKSPIGRYNIRIYDKDCESLSRRKCCKFKQITQGPTSL